MKLNFREIYEGWRNHLLPPSKLKKAIEKVSKERLAICEYCEYNSRYNITLLRPDIHCTICGCTLSAKTKCLSCCCPEEKWMCVISPEEEEQILEENGE